MSSMHNGKIDIVYQPTCFIITATTTNSILHYYYYVYMCVSEREKKERWVELTWIKCWQLAKWPTESMTTKATSQHNIISQQQTTVVLMLMIPNFLHFSLCINMSIQKSTTNITQNTRSISLFVVAAGVLRLLLLLTEKGGWFYVTTRDLFKSFIYIIITVCRTNFCIFLMHHLWADTGIIFPSENPKKIYFYYSVTTDTLWITKASLFGPCRYPINKYHILTYFCAFTLVIK